MPIEVKDIFKAPYIAYSPDEIRTIRRMLGETTAAFADRFKLSESEVKAWEAQEGSSKHREPNGPAGLLLYWAAVEANSRVSARNRRIRLASLYGKK